MTHVHTIPRWDRRGPGMPPVLEEKVWLERRQLLKAFGFGGLVAASSPAFACGVPFAGQAGDGIEEDPTTTYEPSKTWVPSWEPAGGKALYPAKRNEEFQIVRSLTPEDVVAKYNNFYEFYPGRAGPVYKYTDGFVPRPWTIRIQGEVEEERALELDDLAKIAPLEERLYHFRCVEAWSMVVPWIGIPMAKLVEWAKPKPSAKYVRFVTLDAPDRFPAVKKQKHYPWPYFEGLRIDEAMNPLSLLVTGIYGHGLPTQHGAPVRVIVPWKYGFKSAKSIEVIEFTTEEPPTFWNKVNPREYKFLSNVEPDVPHPRWSQATERDLATGDRVKTRSYNGYGEYVAKLYDDK